jgi:aspergillopepsin I
MFFPSTILLAASLLAPHVNAKSVKSKVSTATAFQAASDNSITSNVLTLTKKSSVKGYNPRSAAYLSKKVAATNQNSTLLSLDIGEEFATNVTFGTETFEALVDTGSSDTWLAESGFQCVNITNSAPIPEENCQFGPTYNVTDTFKQIANENFNITYGDGEFLTGIFGTEQVTVANIVVDQQVALVNFAAWEGDGTTSGLVGFAYPNM